MHLVFSQTGIFHPPLQKHILVLGTQVDWVGANCGLIERLSPTSHIAKAQLKPHRMDYNSLKMFW